MAKKPESAEPENPEVELRRQLAEARSQLSSSEAARQQAETRAHELEVRNLSEGERRLLAQEQSLDSAISATEGEQAALKTQYAGLLREAATDPKKYDDVAEVQAKIADAAALLAQQRSQKEWFGAERERIKAQPQPQQPQRQARANKPADIFDVNRCTPATRQWIDRHPEFLDDWQTYHRAIAADSLAQAEGIERDTPEYFRFVDAQLKPSTQEPDEPEPASEAAPAGDTKAPAKNGEVDYRVKNPQPAAAGNGSALPPSRTVPTGSRQQRGAPNLNSEEKEIADALYAHLPNPADRYTHYAQNRDFMNARRAH